MYSCFCFGSTFRLQNACILHQKCRYNLLDLQIQYRYYYQQQSCRLAGLVYRYRYYRYCLLSIPAQLYWYWYYQQYGSTAVPVSRDPYQIQKLLVQVNLLDNLYRQYQDTNTVVLVLKLHPSCAMQVQNHWFETRCKISQNGSAKQAILQIRTYM